jgi:hypothetical protein
MQNQERNEGPESDHDEEQEAGHHRNLPQLRDQDVQDRQSEIKPTPAKYAARAAGFEMRRSGRVI